MLIGTGIGVSIRCRASHRGSGTCILCGTPASQGSASAVQALKTTAHDAKTNPLGDHLLLMEFCLDRAHCAPDRKQRQPERGFRVFTIHANLKPVTAPCRSSKNRYAPPMHTISPTEMREITTYKG
jgi:hypothetical protein